MRGVGFVVGCTLEDMQNQWGKFIDANVDVILFDRHFINQGLDFMNPANLDPEKRSIWKYMETMRAGQDISGNYGDYQTLMDLQPGDTLVLTDLSKLEFSKIDIWPEIYEVRRLPLFE